MRRKRQFSTRDLVTIALLSCLGAVMSTYVGYLGRMLGTVTGVPLASQALTGLHVLWPVLALGLIDKPGAGMLAALLDVSGQFLMGSHLGAWVLPVGLAQGLCAEAAYWTLHRLGRAPALVLAGGLAATPHLLIMRAVVLHSFPRVLFGALWAAAFCSGLCLAGLLSCGALRVLERTGLAAGHGRPPPDAASTPRAP